LRIDLIVAGLVIVECKATSQYNSIQRNRALHRLAINGVTVEYRTPAGEIRGAQARAIDFDDPENDDWLAVNQFSVSENKRSRRPDVVLFVNGLPLAVLELKNAADEDATIWSRASAGTRTAPLRRRR
jgi:type I restriction enzyme R subunit